MVGIPEEVAVFFERQTFVIVSTIDENGNIHCSAKGLVGLDGAGQVYLLDLYKRKTWNNIQQNPAISITAVNEQEFAGYSLKGTARIVPKEDVKSEVVKAWERKIVRRISERLIKNVQGEDRSMQPEAHLPSPQYLIVMEVSEIVDLTPAHIKKHL